MEDHMHERRERVARALGLNGAVLVVGAGEPVPLPENSDQTYPFVAHAEYAYLADNETPGGIVAFDPSAPRGREWANFTPEVTEAERVWEGRQPVPGAPTLADFDRWLAARASRTFVSLGSPVHGLRADPALSAAARAALTHARRPKDASELALVRRAVAATAAGYSAVSAAIRPGVTERQLQVELEAGFLRGGADRTGFATIVGAGPDSAVLHFSPGPRAVREGDFVLIDSGAQVGRYTADVTRTFVAGGPTPFQRDLYQVVLDAQVRAIGRCTPGAEWKDVHLGCAVDMVAGLVAMGLMRGNPSSLVEREAHTLFFPHGLGHMVGLGVRDASGLEPGRTRDPRPCLRTLRMDLPLRAGYLVTVEPGLYLIPPLLDDPDRRTRYGDCVNWSLVDRYKHFGGVRIEDDVLVTSGSPEVLTAAIPKLL